MRVQISSRSAVAITTPFWPLMLLTACGTSPEGPAPEPTDAVAYEGGRIIVGDGGVIENGTLLVEGDRLLAVGGTDSVDVPAGAERVDLTGRTLMPAIIDPHVHLRETRDELVEDLQRKAYYGVGVVLSLGRGVSELAFQLRNEAVTNAARYRTVGRGITAPEPGRTEVPSWVTTEEEARAAVRELVPQNVDMVKIWVDARNGPQSCTARSSTKHTSTDSGSPRTYTHSKTPKGCSVPDSTRSPTGSETRRSTTRSSNCFASGRMSC